MRNSISSRAMFARSMRFLAGLASSSRGRAWIAGALVLAVLVLVAGHELEHHFGALEKSFATLGPGGDTALLVLYVVATSLLLPDTVFRVAAGALFGFAHGTLGVVVGTLLGSLLQFAIARPLRPWIDRLVSARPTLGALRRAVLTDGLRLQLLIRLTPINHASVSYVLGAGGVRLWPFLAALPAMLPSILLEVWVGHTGRSAAGFGGGRSVGGEDLVMYGGLA